MCAPQITYSSGLYELFITNLTVNANAANPTNTIILVNMDCKLFDSTAGWFWFCDSSVLFMAALLLSSACNYLYISMITID